MKLYETAFDMYDEKVAQILINRNDFGDRSRFLNLRNTVAGLIEMGFIPIANENDTVSTEEITFGDNDLLAAMTAVGWKADYLTLMSSVSGILDENGEIIEVFNSDSKIKKMNSTSWGTGGIETKINAGITAATTGIKVCICDGRKLDNINQFLSGKNVGTTFESGKIPTSKKAWIGFLSNPNGCIIINEGACRAIMEKKSLLPVGIVEVKGRFESGDVIDVKNNTGTLIGRGMVNFNSTDTEKITGHQSEELKNILGFECPKVYIHADNFWVYE
jgi:glutamate 5-kinase